jgi:hypothetical protein
VQLVAERQDTPARLPPSFPDGRGTVSEVHFVPLNDSTSGPGPDGDDPTAMHDEGDVHEMAVRSPFPVFFEVRAIHFVPFHSSNSTEKSLSPGK